MNQNVLVGLVLVAVVGIGGLLYRGSAITVNSPVTVESPAGRSFGGSGADEYSFANFFGGMSVGQGVNASSTSASVTMSGSEFLNADTLAYTVNVPDKTLTLPASTTPMCTSIPAGQRRTVLVRHASTSATSVLTIAGSSSIVLKQATSSITASLVTINGSTNGSGYGAITLVKRQFVSGGTVGCDALIETFN